MIRMTLAVLALTAATPAFAETVVPLPPFQALDLHGGGDVVLKHGAVQKVTILKGDPNITKLAVKNGTLDVSPCGGDWTSCPSHYDLKVEIVTPMLSAISVHGGGDLTTQGAFPAQDRMSLAIHGGGDADVKAIPVRSANVNVHGGGDLRVTATDALNGSVEGGGDVTYWGHPKTLAVTTNGGGDISSGE